MHGGRDMQHCGLVLTFFNVNGALRDLDVSGFLAARFVACGVAAAAPPVADLPGCGAPILRDFGPRGFVEASSDSDPRPLAIMILAATRVPAVSGSRTHEHH